jgi:lactate dehydrogenase-like 2-hydroxyacid dehydrogenase
VAGFGGPLRVKPGASWGVIGLGEIGAEVARKVTATGGSVVIADIRTPRLGLLAELNVRRYSLDLLVAGSDAISVHVHLGPTASPLISGRELGLMKPGAVLINTSHPSVVDEKAVVEALSAGTLAGYATDCPGEVISGVDESLASPGKLFITTNPLTNQVGAAQQIAKFVAANIQAFRDGSGVEGMIDLVDFPTVGDPSFWSSRMSPRQD